MSLLRFDGLYCTPPLGADWQHFWSRVHDYYQFFPDGRVASTTSTGTPEQVAKWLHKIDDAAGRYSVNGDRVTMTIYIVEAERSKGGAIEYTGRILHDRLLLSSLSHITGCSRESEALFVAVSGLAVSA
jgi:hypothetical protein